MGHDCRYDKKYKQNLLDARKDDGLEVKVKKINSCFVTRLQFKTTM